MKPDATGRCTGSSGQQQQEMEGTVAHKSCIVSTPEFQLLLRETSLRPLLRRELDSRFIPDGFAEDDVWSTLLGIRKAQGIFSPNIEYAGGVLRRNWHSEPASMQRSLRELGDMTRAGSFLDETIRKHAGYYFLLQQYVEEALTNLGFDGFACEYDQIRAVMRRARKPRTAAEQLAANYHEIMCDLDSYASEAVDTELLDRIYARLTGSVSQDGLEVRPRPVFPLPGLDACPADTGRVRDVVVATCNDRLSEPWQHPIMVSMLVNCRFWRLMPFPACNHLMGNIIVNVYQRKHGLPALSVIPKAHLIDLWSRQALPSVAAPYAFGESFVSDGADTDWTAYYDMLLGLMLREAQRVQCTMRTLDEDEDRLIDLVRSLPNLNRRQHDLLQESILDPTREFWVSRLSRQWGVVYSTVRCDLRQLYEQGFFTCFVRESTNVYRSVPNVADVVEQQARKVGILA